MLAAEPRVCPLTLRYGAGTRPGLHVENDPPTEEIRLPTSYEGIELKRRLDI
jgi:hypothetical protein